MKKRLLVLSSLLTVLVSAAEDDWVLNNAFAIWGDVAFIRRAEGHEQHIFFEGQGAQAQSACNLRTLISHFNYEPGFRVGMAYMTRHTFLEATYLWVADWDSSCHRRDPRRINFSENTQNVAGDYANADRGSTHFNSQFRNGEINYFFYVTPRRGNYFSAAWLVGLRYMDFPEHLDIAFVKGANRSTYEIDTENHIPAAQVGATLGWNPTRTLSWDLLAKVGLGFNWCKQHTFMGNQNNTVTLRNYTRSEFSTPLVVAGGLTLTYQPWKFFNLHMSYELIYLNGVATAPVQINKSRNPSHEIKSDGYALFHGWLGGVTFSF